MAATAILAVWRVYSQRAMLDNPTYSVSTAGMPHSPTNPLVCHSSHAHRWRVGRNPIGQQHNPNTGGEKKKYETQGKTKGLHHLAIPSSHACACVSVCMHACAHV